MSSADRHAKAFDEWWERKGKSDAQALFGDAWDANVYVEYCRSVAIDAWTESVMQIADKSSKE